MGVGPVDPSGRGDCGPRRGRALLVAAILLAVFGVLLLAAGNAVTQSMGDAAGADADIGGMAILFLLPFFVVIWPAALVAALASVIVAIVSLVQEGWRWAWLLVLVADAAVLAYVAEPALQMIALLL